MAADLSEFRVEYCFNSMHLYCPEYKNARGIRLGDENVHTTLTLTKFTQACQRKSDNQYIK